MACLYLDSVEQYATADISDKWTGSTVGSFAVSQPTLAVSANGRTGTNSLRFAYGATTTSQAAARAFVQKTLTPADATCITGFAFRTSAAPAAKFPICSIYDGLASAEQVTLVLNTDMTLALYRGAGNGTLLGTTSQALSVNAYHYIELKVTISDAAGAYEIRLDGVSRLSASSVDTQATANASWNNVRYGYSAQCATASNSSLIGAGGGGSNWDYDDLYVCDGSGGSLDDFLGDLKIYAVLPNADGGNNDFTLSTGVTHSTLVDDSTPNDDTDYVSSSTVGHRDSWNFTNLPSTVGTIVAVQVNLQARKDDAGTRKIVEVVRISSTNYDGATEATLTTGYLDHYFVLPTNPATTAAWTKSDVDGAEFGVKITA